jgi:hypothetical protein
MKPRGTHRAREAAPDHNWTETDGLIALRLSLILGVGSTANGGSLGGHATPAPTASSSRPRPAWESHVIRHIQNCAQRLIYGSVGGEGLSHFRIKKHQIGARAVLRHVFPSHATLHG